MTRKEWHGFVPDVLFSTKDMVIVLASVVTWLGRSEFTYRFGKVFVHVTVTDGTSNSSLQEAAKVQLNVRSHNGFRIRRAFHYLPDSVRVFVCVWPTGKSYFSSNFHVMLSRRSGLLASCGLAERDRFTHYCLIALSLTRRR